MKPGWANLKNGLLNSSVKIREHELLYKKMVITYDDNKNIIFMNDTCYPRVLTYGGMIIFVHLPYPACLYFETFLWQINILRFL
jgi:hypothetical protein